MSYTQEEAEEAVKEKLEMVDDIAIIDQPKQQVAAAAMIMECCLVMARDIVQRRYTAKEASEYEMEVTQEIGFKMFEALMKPVPQPAQQFVPLDPRAFGNIPKV